MEEANKVPQSSISISLCMIVKNEEKVLGRCLESVAGIADEIIVVDTGSTDRTQEIAGQFTASVHHFQWIHDFSAARNFAFSLATKDYILWLDADDIFLPEDRSKFLQLKYAPLDPAIDTITMLYNLSHDQYGKVTSQLRRNRLVKRSNNFQWVGAVHEYLAVAGQAFHSDIAVTHSPLEHDADRNLLIYEERQKKGEIFSPRDLYYFANELLDHQLYNRAIEYYQRFLATKQGWVEDNIGACGKLADSFYHLSDPENQLKYIFTSFTYDTPRADFCCRLGFHFLQANQLLQAIFWYKTATQLEQPSETWGLVNYSCRTWLPHLQLCVCYSRIGKYQLAHEHNEQAAKYMPDDPRIAHNRKFLRSFIEPQPETVD